MIPGVVAASEGIVKRRLIAAEIGLELHRSIAVMVAQTCGELTRETGLHTVALSGGCFQNRLLLRLTVEALVSDGYQVLTHRQVPCNDGGLSLGQAIIAGLNPGTVKD